jgi:hypothetical protein
VPRFAAGLGVVITDEWTGDAILRVSAIMPGWGSRTISWVRPPPAISAIMPEIRITDDRRVIALAPRRDHQIFMIAED